MKCNYLKLKLHTTVAIYIIWQKSGFYIILTSTHSKIQLLDTHTSYSFVNSLHCQQQDDFLRWAVSQLSATSRRRNKMPLTLKRIYGGFLTHYALVKFWWDLAICWLSKRPPVKTNTHKLTVCVSQYGSCLCLASHTWQGTLRRMEWNCFEKRLGRVNRCESYES